MWLVVRRPRDYPLFRNAFLISGAIGLALLDTSRWLPARAFAVLMPLAMLAAIVLTANHYLADAAGGAAVALTGLAAARYLRGRDRRPSLRWRTRVGTSMPAVRG